MKRKNVRMQLRWHDYNQFAGLAIFRVTGGAPHRKRRATLRATLLIGHIANTKTLRTPAGRCPAIVNDDQR
jgi:hypothetical protein